MWVFHFTDGLKAEYKFLCVQLSDERMTGLTQITTIYIHTVMSYVPAVSFDVPIKTGYLNNTKVLRSLNENRFKNWFFWW